VAQHKTVMSKQVGIIKLDGTIGGISFYTAGGQSLARVATGPSKERIAKDQAFQRTRENNREFAGSAKAAKALRLAMGGLLQTMGGGRIASELTKLFKSINLRSPGARGERQVKLSANRSLLNNVEFNSKVRFSSIFSAPYTVSVNATRNEATVVIEGFVPGNALQIPSGATHFNIICGVGIVSDYTLDPTTGTYQALQPLQDSQGANTSSSALPINQAAAQQTLVVSVDAVPTVNAVCSTVVTLGIEFYQEVNGQLYIFAQDNAMKVVGVF
jgi:hypothetical protein